jgi:hypothetical protein
MTLVKHNHVQLPSGQIKRDLESLLRQSLKSENPHEVDELFHLIVDKSNELRRNYNLPEIVNHSHNHMSIMKTPTEQLQAAGVADETVMGRVVFGRASVDSSYVKKDQLCLFDQCFNDKSHADIFRRNILKNIDENMSDSDVRSISIYPPLLLRSVSDDIFGIHVDAQGNACRPQVSSKPMNMLIVMYQEGPIVPVLDKNNHNRFQRLVYELYALRGSTCGPDFLNMLVS